MRKKQENKEYFNVKQILKKKDICYDVTIGEHSKGRNYVLQKMNDYLLGIR